MANRRRWTERDVAEILDRGRAVARRILAAFDADPTRSLDDKAAAYRTAPAAARRAAAEKIAMFLRAEGVQDGLAAAHVEGALMLIDAGHPMAEEADRLRRH